MGDEHAAHTQPLDVVEYPHLVLGVQKRRALVHEQQPRPPVDGPRQQDALQLPLRQGRAHIADEGFILHGQGRDVVMNPRRLRRLPHPLHIGREFEETDVVQNRARKQVVGLTHPGDGLPVTGLIAGVQHPPVHQHLAGAGGMQPHQHIEQGGLADAGRPEDGATAAGGDMQMQILEHHGPVLIVGETGGFEAQLPAHGKAHDMAVLQPRLLLGVDDVRQPLQVQVKHLVFKRLIDDGEHGVREIAPIGHERIQHTDAQGALKHKAGPEKHHQHLLQPQQQRGDGLVTDGQPSDTGLGAHAAHELLLPARLPLLLPSRQFDAAQGPHRFDEVAVQLGPRRHALQVARPQRMILADAEHGIEQGGGQHDEGQHAGVKRHHHQGGHRQQPVDHHRHRAGGDETLHRRERLEARDHIPQMTAAEKGHGQPQQMMHDAVAGVVVQLAGEVDAAQPPRVSHKHREQGEAEEAEGQHQQQVAV